MKDQPKTNYYESGHYDSKRRFISYWHQISETLETQPKHALEIGMGNGFVKRYLEGLGIKVVTLDIDAALQPDIVGGVERLQDLSEKSFDVIMACEVLEHIPYQEALEALEQMARVSTYVVLSLPDNTPWFSVNANLPLFGRIKFFYEKRKTIKRNFEHDLRGHYWEIGVNNVSQEKLEKDLKKNFRIEKTYRVSEHPAHHFFVLKSHI